MTKHDTFISIINLWPNMVELHADLKKSHQLKYDAVKAWKKNNSIPSCYWIDLIRAAEVRGFCGVTLEALAALSNKWQLPHAFSIGGGCFQTNENNMTQVIEIQTYACASGFAFPIFSSSNKPTTTVCAVDVSINILKEHTRRFSWCPFRSTCKIELRRF